MEDYFPGYVGMEEENAFMQEIKSLYEISSMIFEMLNKI
jgi:hypothetical protein